VICGVWCPTRVEIRNGIGFDGAVFEGWLPDRMSYWLAHERFWTGSTDFINHFIGSKVCKAGLIRVTILNDLHIPCGFHIFSSQQIIYWFSFSLVSGWYRFINLGKIFANILNSKSSSHSLGFEILENCQNCCQIEEHFYPFNF